MKKRLKAYFSGRVQGVGFRFTAERLSRHFEVTGYVRNLSNGKVEVLAEGEEAVLKDFLQAICVSEMSCYIKDVNSEWGEAADKYQTFGIAY